MYVLIIEPDHILAKEYKRAFKEAGIDTDLCSSAQNAIMSIDNKLPDAVVAELQLTGHSGVEFLHEFRSYEDWASVPVFVHSKIPEYAIGADSNTWKSFGVVRYFYKPNTSMKQLIGAVKGQLS
jgi:DNA-binding response OmpR family regulator